MAHSFRDTGFRTAREEYSRLAVSDGTVIRAKAVVRKILFSPQITPEGYPEKYSVDTVNVISATVPEKLMGPPSDRPFDGPRSEGEAMEFDEQKIEAQEYVVSGGFKLVVKPAVSKIVRHGTYNEFGEPVYGIVMRAVADIKKTAG